MEPAPATAAQRILQLIEHLGISPYQFAKEVGLSHQTISNVTTGKSKPSLDTLEAIAGRYPNTATWLLTGSGSMLREGKELTPMKAEPLELQHQHTRATILPISAASAIDAAALLEAERRRAERAEAEADRARAEADRAWALAERERERAEVLQAELIQKINLYLFPHDEEPHEANPQQPEPVPAGKADADSLAAGINPNTGKPWVGVPRDAEGNVRLHTDRFALLESGEVVRLDAAPARRSFPAIGVDYSDSAAA